VTFGIYKENIRQAARPVRLANEVWLAPSRKSNESADPRPPQNRSGEGAREILFEPPWKVGDEKLATFHGGLLMQPDAFRKTDTGLNFRAPRPAGGGPAAPPIPARVQQTEVQLTSFHFGRDEKKREDAIWKTN